MTDRERLIDLIKDLAPDLVAKCPDACDTCTHGDCVGKLADHLLANGIIVPPCKVGDTVYFPVETDGECEPYVEVGTVFAIGIGEMYTMWISARYESDLKYYHTSDDFGKTVFLTKEEAEQALKEREGKWRCK